MRTIVLAVLVVLAIAVASSSPAQATDLAPWDGVWFKTKVKEKGVEFHATAPGTQKESFGGTAYVQLHFDPGTPDRLGMDVWVNQGTWVKQSLALVYVAGANDDMLVALNQIPVSPAPITSPTLQFSFAARLSGKVSGGSVDKGSFKTFGGYFIEIDDAAGSDLRGGGSLSLSGKSTTKLPSDLPQS